MRTSNVGLACVLVFGLTVSYATAQGSLTPPGAPTPTMKTLEQIEPRTPISSAPYTISESGSYYLTTNLTSTGHGVVIAASGVTLDLMGFTLSGDRGASDNGVFLDGATNSAIWNVVVHNGIIRNFGNGVRVEHARDSRFERLMSTTNVSEGIDFDGDSGQCNGNIIADCTITGNGGSGVDLFGRASGQCDGNTITDCTISGNTSLGVCLSGNGGQCNGNILADCTMSGNGSKGVCLVGFDGQCNGNTITDCTISGNGSFGVYLYCSIGGQCDGNTIADCTIRKNGVRGIYMDYADSNRVEGNHITGQIGGTTRGIYCSSTDGNLIVRNTCVGQHFNFDITPNDTYGPIVTSAGALSTTNGAAALSPWANFSR